MECWWMDGGRGRAKLGWDGFLLQFGFYSIYLQISQNVYIWQGININIVFKM